MEIKAQQQALGFLMASSRCLNTRNILRIRTAVSMDMTIKWVLCHTNMEETVLHLFFGCQFSKACWHWVGLTWIMPLPFFQHDDASRKKIFTVTFLHSWWFFYNSSLENLEATEWSQFFYKRPNISSDMAIFPNCLSMSRSSLLFVNFLAFVFVKCLYIFFI